MFVILPASAGRSPQGKLKPLETLHRGGANMGRDSTPENGRQEAARMTVGRWHADPAADTLTLDGRTVKLEPRTMRLLVALAERPGEVCNSDALLDAVWPNVIVTGQSLYQAIGELRSALKDDTLTGEFIATVPRKGYRLVAPVQQAPLPASTLAPVPLNPPPTPGARTIAVLPFRDLGLPTGLSFLLETLLGDLVLELSRQPGLTTIGRGTMLAYRGQTVSPRRIADDLNVRYVVDGAIAHVDGRLSISCDLIDASNEAVLASESIEVPAANWPELGQRVVGRLVRVWRLEMTEHAARDVDTAGAERASALELAMRAWVELYCRPQSRDTNDRAWKWAAEAVHRDASIGAAWNVLAYCEYRAAQYDWHDATVDELLADAVAHAERATELSPSDPDAHYTLGLALFNIGERARAEASLRHCLQISASFAPAYGLLALVGTAAGHPERAFELCERALALSPLEPLRAVWHWGQACASSMLGREEDALAYAARGIAANPAFPSCYVIAAVAARRLGREQEAARFVSVLRTTAFRSIERLRRRIPSLRVEPWASAFLEDLRAAGLPER
jgi:DNA-binding winged helix-turn-helix (wHTH) protein/tetratricopeptide (TPR) repeat protein